MKPNNTAQPLDFQEVVQEMLLNRNYEAAKKLFTWKL